MKNIVISALLVIMASSFAVAAERPSEAPKMRSWTKMALSTQTPRVKLSRADHYQTPKNGYRITSDKTTINAYVPYGK